MSGAKPSRRAILRAAPGLAVATAMPFAISDALQAAIERQRSAWLAFGEASDRTDTIAVEEKGGTVTAQDEANYDIARDAEVQTFSDLAAFPCATLADHARKAAYLLTTCTVADGFMQEDDVKALLLSLVGNAPG